VASPAERQATREIELDGCPPQREFGKLRPKLAAGGQCTESKASFGDIIKLADGASSIRSFAPQGCPPDLLLQVHDDLVLEAAPTPSTPFWPPVKKRVMEKRRRLPFPLVVDTGWGANWMETK